MTAPEAQYQKTKRADDSDPQFEALLDYLRFSRGFDFTGYKRSSLMRRVKKRCHMLSVNSFSEYLDYMQVHPEEFANLFNTILINVTSFFRDKPAWESLSTVILPRLMAHKTSSDPIRVWSAGCASGEEAYSLAIALTEFLGPEAYRQRVKIYATDMDNEALAQARQAVYSNEDLKNIPEDLREKYFISSNGGYILNGDTRRAVIFGQHDIVQDAPISRLDLLVCRNTLMYFNAETQARILARFHFALNENGILFLGKAEMLLTHANLFTPLDLKNRFFSKVYRPELHDRIFAMTQTTDDPLATRLGRQIRMRDLAFDTSPEPQLIVDLNGILIAANEKAKSFFSLAPKNIGTALNKLDIFHPPVVLRSLIDQAIGERHPVMVTGVEYSLNTGQYSNYVDVHVFPLEENNRLLGVSMLFVDVTHIKGLAEQLKSSTAELETSNEELQSTNEELETTNEELQSTVEELETTNEELQSTVEELEATNEELSSTNEELETINDQLSHRTSELNDSKAFLETVISNLRSGLAVLDREYHILAWSQQSEDLWGLRAEETIGQSLLGLDIGLPVEKLIPSIRTILDERTDAEEVILTAINRRGKSFQCRITFTPFTINGKEREGIVLMMEEKVEES